MFERFLFATLFSLVYSTGVSAQSNVNNEPATARQAAAVLDLSQFPLVALEGEPNCRSIASQSYSARGNVTEIAGMIRQNFIEAGCQLLPGGMSTEDYASESYQKSGFTFSVSVMPGSDRNTSTVIINNHGNVDLSKIPAPKASMLLYATPAVIAYNVDQASDVVNREFKQRMVDLGWSEFGDTEVSFFVKKNGIRLQVMVNPSPVQDGKSMLQITAEQLSCDLPAPPNIEWLQYADSTTAMQFQCDCSADVLLNFFTQSLVKDNWKSTTESAIETDGKRSLVFRNEAGEMVMVDVSLVDGKTRGEVKHQTAEQVKAEDRAAKDFAEKMKEEAKKAKLVELKLPSIGKQSKDATSDKSVEFALQSGSARKIVAAWIAERKKEGWDVEATVDTKEIGHFTLRKDNVSLRVTFADPGFIPAEVDVSATGAKLVFE